MGIYTDFFIHNVISALIIQIKIKAKAGVFSIVSHNRDSSIKAWISFLDNLKGTTLHNIQKLPAGQIHFLHQNAKAHFRRIKESLIN